MATNFGKALGSISTGGGSTIATQLATKALNPPTATPAAPTPAANPATDMAKKTFGAMLGDAGVAKPAVTTSPGRALATPNPSAALSGGSNPFDYAGDTGTDWATASNTPGKTQNGGAAPPPPPAPAPSPAADVDPGGFYSNALKSIDAQDANAKQRGQDNIAALQRRSATLSALSGRGIGGGFLQGQTSATVQGLNAEQQELAANESLRQNIYGTEGGQAFSAAQQEKQNKFNLGMQTAAGQGSADADKVNQKRTDYATAMQSATGLTFGELNADEQNMIQSASSGDPQAVQRMNDYIAYVKYMHQKKHKDVDFNQYRAGQG